MDNRFQLNSHDCEILLEFERQGSLQALADALGKDISVVSRNLKAIAGETSCLEKIGGRWALTPEGLALNHWTREAVYSQRLALQRQKSLVIATTREFASRVLIPQTRSLVGNEDLSISVISSDDGIEDLVLSGKADFGFDCGRPKDPLVSFKRVAKEPFALVASPDFIKRFKIKSFEDLESRDHLKFGRNPNSILDLDVEATRYYGTFSDIQTLREACILGYGWAILPKYAVKKELKEKILKEVSGLNIEDEKFGVWWLRERKSLEPWIKKATKWLKEQEKHLI